MYYILRFNAQFHFYHSVKQRCDALTHCDPEFQIKITEIFFDFIFFLENITWLLSDIKFIT